MIRCQNLTKRYPLAPRERYRALRDAISDRVRNPFGRREQGSFLALDDFTATFAEGEVTGIIGRNGAGKSTLLKILSRVTRPSAGVAEIGGRVGSLLEVGTGFHPELSGRENIYFNGAILGMRKREIDARFDEIVAFADVEAFLDMPVKRYSSGMYVRLAFAVGAHLDTDVLLVDEVLAVGDAAFQKKCLGKMQDVTAGSGRTILFISHNLNAVQRLCPRTILLDRGRIAADGPTQDVIAGYLQEASESAPGEWMDLTQAARRGTGGARFVAMRFVEQPVSNEPLELEVEIVSKGDRVVPRISATITDRYGTKLVNCDSLGSGETARLRDGHNFFRLRVEALHLNGGLFNLSLWLALSAADPIDYIDTALTFRVADRPTAMLGARPRRDGVVVSDYSWSPLDPPTA
jgi:ABC-type polysaccharide/polyol phosphate transport system ATPase subunit